MQRVFQHILVVILFGFMPAAQARSLAEREIVQSAGDVAIPDEGDQKASIDPNAGTIIATGINGRAVVRDGTLAAGRASASGPGALRLATTPDMGDAASAITDLEGEGGTTFGLRRTLAGDNALVIGPGNSLERTTSVASDAARILAANAQANIHSLARHQPLKVVRTLPWTEMSLGALALIAMMVTSNIRDLHARTKKLEALA